MGLGDHDRQESAVQAELAGRALLLAKDQFHGLSDLERPRPGSVLAAEGILTAYDRSHAQVAANYARSMDHLDLFFRTTVGDQDSDSVAYPFALFPGLRAALESAAVALWLIGTSKKSERVLRALRLSYRNANDRADLAVALGAPDRPGDAVVRRLNELKDAVPTLRQIELGPPPRYSTILRSVSPARRGGPDPTSPFILWKVSSAFLHGSEYLIRDLSDVRQLTEWSGGVASFEVSPSLRMLSGIGLAAVELLQRVERRYTELATTDYAGRSV